MRKLCSCTCVPARGRSRSNQAALFICTAQACLHSWIELNLSRMSSDTWLLKLRVQPESCKQVWSSEDSPSEEGLLCISLGSRFEVHSPRSARRKVWRAVPILRGEHGDEEASGKRP